MKLLSVLGAILLACNAVNGFGLHGFHFRGMEEPEVQSLNENQIVTTAWITQPLDHFNHRENRTWSMRYMENRAFFKKNGPIFIMIGGEWEIGPGYLQTGLMYSLAPTHNAMLYYTEHRYYGKSLPTEDTSSENMQYLNVDQALADLAYFIEVKKQDEEMRDSPVIVFGGSYAGNMAAWARLKYPHLIQGALASSAPVYAKADFYEYYEVVTNSLARHSAQCAADVKEAYDSVEELMTTEEGLEKIKTQFNLCRLLNVDSLSEIAYFMNILSEKFASAVQYDRPENGVTKIAAICNRMTDTGLGSPLQRLASMVAKKDRCTLISYENFVETYRNVSWESPAAKSVMRQWYHQTCTEYGYYQTSNSKKSVFGTLFTLPYFINVCIDLYGDYYDNSFLESRIKRTNIMYGGLRPDLKNVIFSNGDIDPWHALSVLQDLNEYSPAIFINGSSHCRDLGTDDTSDVADLTKARSKIRQIIGGWLES